VGGGAAGQLAAIEAARGGHEVVLFEKNEKLGKKLYLTGKGRCNVTNAAEREDFFANIPRNPRFLYSAFAAFDNADIVTLLHKQGVPTKVERGQRVFPASDKSSDVLAALRREVLAAGVAMRLNTEVTEILAASSPLSAMPTSPLDSPLPIASASPLSEGGMTGGLQVRGLRLAGGTEENFDAIVLATGGLSYPQTGCTGDGYRFAEALGHRIVPPAGALVPFETEEDWPCALSGLTLKNVSLTAAQNGKTVYRELGELLLTHFGLSGPLALTCSSLLALPAAGTKLFIDLKPGLSPEQLDARLVRDLAAGKGKTVGNALSGRLPARLLAVVLELAGLDAAQAAGECTKAARRALGETLKALPLTVRDLRPIDEAIITRGGVDVRDVNPKTLESRKVAGLYFAGELLDVDALTGGYNLQIAWSTGALAGQVIGNK